ncbi:MAG: InlB B-repeat-containing protein, partial [Bacilli bacterium]|nr:InlB B-repeat-containing protein [Bacilli bacterium]
AVKEDVGYVTNDYIESIVAAFHTLTYHYNGSIVGYASYSELVADFVNDFNYITGKNYTPAGLYGAGAERHATFFNSDAMNAKWSWLIDSFENLRLRGYGNHEYSTASYAHAKAKTLNKDDGHDMYPLRQNVQGFMTKTKCDEHYPSCAIDFSSGDVQELMFATMTDEKLVQSGGALVANPTRDGYTFAGWYDNSSLTGSAVENVGENTDLYAKWNLSTYNVTFMDGESVLDLSPSTYNIKQAKNLPEYDKPGFRFNGWYDNPSFTGDEKTEINVGTFGDLVFYAKTDEITGYTVNFNYNGGNIYYEDIDDVIEDYLADYNSYNNRSYTTATYPNIGQWDEADKTVKFFYANLSKWGWLVDFFATNASVKNKPGYVAFRNYNNYDDLNAAKSDYKYEIAYETRGWVGKMLWNTNASFPTTDWSDEDNQALTMAWLSNISQTEYLNNNGTVVLSTLVPHVYKQGYDFVGWYDNPSFTGDAKTSVTEETTLYAKWEEVVDITQSKVNTTVAEIEAMLSSLDVISEDINLPVESHGCTITWYTTDKDALSTTGAYGTPNRDVKVTLTAEISFDAYSSSVSQELDVRRFYSDLTNGLTAGYVYKNEMATMSDYTVENLDIVYVAFAYPRDDGSVETSSISSYLNDFVARCHAHGTYVVLSLQEHEDANAENGDAFSYISASAELRAIFNANLIDIINTYHLDGIDMDWEHPEVGEESQYTDLMRDLYAAIKANNKYHLLTTATSGADKYTRFNLTESIQYIDYINLMTYDLHSSSRTQFTSALVQGGEGKSYRGIDQTYDNYVNTLHMPTNKLILGIAFYGLIYHETDGIYTSAPRELTEKKAYSYIYDNYISQVNGSTIQKLWDDLAKGYYVYDSENRICATFDDPASIDCKVKQAHDWGFAGVMYWRDGQDRGDELVTAMVNKVNEYYIGNE